MKTRLFIIFIGAFVTAGIIHFVQEQGDSHRNRRSRGGLRDFGPRARDAGPGPAPSNGRARGGLQGMKIQSLFDQNRDKRLDKQERARARTFVKNERKHRRLPGPRRENAESAPKPGVAVQPGEVPQISDAPLYDENVLRTIFIDFESSDWEEELSDFWKTDVNVPATLIVDDRTINEVGVRFRGTSSFFTVQPGQKRSLNIALDHGEGKERLQGYKTLNLLNSHTDPSFVRTLLFNHVARHYIPAEYSNYLRLVIKRLDSQCPLWADREITLSLSPAI